MAIDLKNGLELKLHFQQDRKLTYKLSTNVEQKVIDQGNVVNQTESLYTAEMVQRVLRLEEDGSAHVISKTEPKDPPGPSSVSYQLISSSGMVLETSGANPANTYSFPEASVAQGEGWEGETKIPLPGRPEPLLCKSVYTLAGSATLHGLECVTIEVVTEEVQFEIPFPGAQGMATVTMASSGLMHFAPSEGILVKMELETLSSPKLGAVVLSNNNTIVQELVA